MAGGHLSFVSVFGHVNIDHIVMLNALPTPGTSQEVTDRFQRLGGPAANIALYCQSLGTPTCLASFIGGDFPPAFMQILKDTGLDLEDLKVIEDNTTPQVWVLCDPEQKQMYFIDQGVFKDLETREVLERSVEKSQWIHLSTGKPEYYTRVAMKAKELGKKVAVDPGQEIHFLYNETNMKEILKYSDAFFGNTIEADLAVKLIGGSGPENLLEYVEFAVITDGMKGSTIYTKEGIIQVPVIKPRDSQDPTGAGDSYRAGFYTGLSKGMDLESCGKLGAAEASIVVARKDPIAEPPTFEEVSQLAGL